MSVLYKSTKKKKTRVFLGTIRIFFKKKFHECKIKNKK